MADKNRLQLIVSAVDRATAPLRQIQHRISALAAPVRRVTARMAEMSRRSGLTAVARGVARIGRSLASATKRAAMFGAKVAAVAGVAAYALHRVARSAMQAGDDLAKNADAIGLSVDAYAQLRFAAERSGVASERFKSAMQRLSKRVGEARAGTGALLTLLKKASPALLQQVTAAQSTEEAFTIMIKAISKLEDPMNRVALANAAFSGAGMDMVKMANAGMPAIDGLRMEYERLAGSQEAFARNAEVATDAMTDASVALSGMRAAVFERLAPIIIKLTERVREFFVANRDKIAVWADRAAAAIDRWVSGGGLEKVGEALEYVTWAARIAIKVVGWVATAFQAAGKGIGYVAFVMYSGVVAHIERLSAEFATIRDVVVGAWEGVLNFFRSLWEQITGIFQAGWEKIQPIIDAVKSVASFLLPETPHAAAFRAEPAQRLTGARTVIEQRAARSQAHVTVDFQNAPRGMRARTAPDNTTDLDLSMGYSLVTP